MSQQYPPPRRKRSPWFVSKAAKRGRIPMEPGDLRALMTHLHAMIGEHLAQGDEGYDTTLATFFWLRDHHPRRNVASMVWRFLQIQDFFNENEGKLVDLHLFGEGDDDRAMFVKESLIDALAVCPFNKPLGRGEYGIDFADVARILAKIEGAKS